MFSEYHPSFFTATIVDWKHLLATNDQKDIIVNSLQFLVENKRIRAYSFVVMPNHIHLIWQILQNHTPANVQRDFMKYASQRILQSLRNEVPT